MSNIGDVITERRARVTALLTAALLITALTLFAATPGAASDEAVSPANAPEWAHAGKKLLSTNSPLGADTPSVAYRPDGAEVMVVYNHWRSTVENRDPYYTVFNGTTWSTPAAIATTSGTKSSSVKVAYDGSGNAHAVWVEPDGIYYARFDRTTRAWSATRKLSAAQTGDDLFLEPDIATNGNEIDVVWAQRVGFENPDIFHTSSTNRGTSWSSPVPVGASAGLPSTSRVPDIHIAPGGQRHLVWQESTLPHSQILYTSKGSLTAAWTSSSVIISTGVGSNSEAEQPRLVVQDGKVHVSFTVSRNISGYRQKWIYYTSCSASCRASSGNWSTPANVSVQPVRVNEFDPFYAISDLMLAGNCTYVFFYGYTDSPPNEVVWDVNSCDSWSNGGRDQITSASVRSMYPAVAASERQIVLVFEQVAAGKHEIYALIGELPPPQVFIPFVVTR
jgi:hypothetical protein